MVFISERIVNISDLEKILERERILIEILNKELEKELPDIEKIKGISREILACHKKSNPFRVLFRTKKN